MKTAFDSAKQGWRVSFQETGQPHRKFFTREADPRQFEPELGRFAKGAEAIRVDAKQSR